MKQDTYPKKEEFNKLVSHDGYSLRINAFFAWLRRSGYTIEYIAERLATTTDDIVLRLRRREKFNERELRILIYLMGAKDAFFVIYFSVVQIPKIRLSLRIRKEDEMSKAEEVEEKLSDIRRNADRNRAIQAMMTDGEQLKTFYRFVANNPHIPLHDA